jgi:hypothetical protein
MYRMAKRRSLQSGPATSVTPHEDFTAGEIPQPGLLNVRRAENGRTDGAQLHGLSYLGQKWGIGSSRFSTEQAINFSRQVWESGAAITGDVPAELNGTISQPFLEQLRAVGKAAVSK